MSQEALDTYLRAVRPRYLKADRREKWRILTEFCLNFGYSRKHAIRLMNREARVRSRRPGPRSLYGPDLIAPLKRLWLASGQACSQRLKAAIPGWLPHYRRRHPELTDEQAEKLLRMSRATIERLLRPVKVRRGLSTTQPPTSAWYKSVIPIQAKDWNVTGPGTLQGDTVAHCGDALQGAFANTLTVTDLHTSWTETRGTWCKGSAAIIEALTDIEKSLPFAIKTIKFDSGSEFMNYGVVSHLKSTVMRERPVEILRGRPYRKNDNCYVEQKNWTHVRELIGYDRLGSPECVPILNALYREYWNPLQNFFLPAMKLLTKQRVGARIQKTYDSPRTPYQRLLDSADVSEETKTKLRAQYESLDPFALAEGIQKTLKELNLVLRNKPKSSLRLAA